MNWSISASNGMIPSFGAQRSKIFARRTSHAAR
jgi:hypothetical protein